MRICPHDGDELLDDVLDQVGPVVADIDVILLPDVREGLQDLKSHLRLSFCKFKLFHKNP